MQNAQHHPALALLCHQEFLEKLSEQARTALGRRVSFLMQRLAVDARRVQYKATQGDNKGWRRSRLGGTSGSHFYAWWAPRGAAPLKAAEGFEALPEGSIVLRDIRHHDDHTPLDPHSPDSHYIPVTVTDLRANEYAPAPWTPPQKQFAEARQNVRLLKGFPGSGKTTALWNAAEQNGNNVLYVTYSNELAALARDYFDRFCPPSKKFQVITFPNFLRRLLNDSTPFEAHAEGRRRMLRDLVPLGRSLGPWTGNPVALYDEIHAHLVGDAVPERAGRFMACQSQRVGAKEFRDRRTKFLGAQAVEAANDAVNRLDRGLPKAFAEHYFPDLALAWRAVQLIRKSPDKIPPEFLGVDCIALDECQDLTPIESLALIELAAINDKRGSPPLSFLIAGDEAQTVRPTDFEWGWLNDLLHARIKSPGEYKLTANLRSPASIAGIVNRVWDLYSNLAKHERPSGAGRAEIDDEATDQILYCTAAAGPELNGVLTQLSAQEGHALVSLTEEIPLYVPEAVRPSVLTVSEAKGLDFRSVCVLDAGKHIEQIGRGFSQFRIGGDVENLRKRLAIDQLRVALSRPTERLFWLDVNPSPSIVSDSVNFLNTDLFGTPITPLIPAALIKALEEENLDLEERIQLCQSDARQLLTVKPEMAWSRARQAVALLGAMDSAAAITDRAARSGAHLTLAEIGFQLGMRRTRMAAELGRIDFFAEAARAAELGGKPSLSYLLSGAGKIMNAGDRRMDAIYDFARQVPRHATEMEGWFKIGIAPKALEWCEELEGAFFSGHNAALLLPVLPSFYEAIDLPDRQPRLRKLYDKAYHAHIKDKNFGSALSVLKSFGEPQPKLEAACHVGLRDYRRAAECYVQAGMTKDALAAYRSVPDIDAALKLIAETGDNNPATESLQWISRLRALISERPEKFGKVILPAEKQLLETELERALGVQRKKPAPRKTVAVKKAAPKKRAASTKRAI